MSFPNSQLIRNTRFTGSDEQQCRYRPARTDPPAPIPTPFMEDFSSDQISSIATGYRSLARALNEFQMRQWPNFSVEQHLDLNAYQSSLLNRAQDLQAMAVRPPFTNARDMAVRIRQAAELATSSLNEIRNLSLALNIGAIAVALTSYVARADSRGIQIAIQELGELIKLEETE